MDIALEIRDLSIRRQGRLVLQVDQLHVQEGEVLAIIGPNGAGKTTLLLSIAKLLRPEHGDIFFFNKRITTKDELLFRRKIALVLQEPLLLDRSVFDNVAAGMRYRKIPSRDIKQRIDFWLARLGISHLRDRPARGLSGGEAQRVSLARAFAIHPRLLMLDEPFSSLDSPTRSRLLEDLKELLDDNKVTTVFITHDFNEALFLGDRVAILLEGRLRQVGPAHEVFSMPADEDIAAFIGVETIIRGKVVECKESRVIIEADGHHLEGVGEIPVGHSVLFCLRPEDVTLWPDSSPPTSSARNRVKGTVQRLSPQGPLMRVFLDCGFPLMALITRTSAEEMDIKIGKKVTAIFKASAVHLIPK